MRTEPQPARAPAASRRQGPGAFRYSAVHLLVALGLVFVSAPLVEHLPLGDIIDGVLVTLVMVSAVLAVGGRRKSLIIALVLLAPALAGKWINHVHPQTLHPAIYLAASAVFFGFVIARLLVFIVRAPRVDANVLCAGVSGFLMLGLFWAIAYLTVARLDSGAFSLPAALGASAVLDSFSAFYFSFITLCTVGYGDITPVSRSARMLAAVEAIAGLFYMAVLISRLVAIYSSSQPAAKPADKGRS